MQEQYLQISLFTWHIQPNALEEFKAGAKDKCQKPLGTCSQHATHLGFSTEHIWSRCVCRSSRSGRSRGERSAWLDARAAARICPQELQSLWIWRWGALLGKARKDPLAEGGWSEGKPTQQGLGGQPQAQAHISSQQTTVQSFYHDLAEVLGGRQSVPSQQRQTDCLQQQIQTWQLNFVKKH